MENSSITLEGEQLETWLKVEKELFQIEMDEDHRISRSQSAKVPTKKRKSEMVRFIVQYPAERTASAIPGPVAFSDYTNKCRTPCECQNHDLLVTIHGNNAEDLLGEECVGILKLVKGTG